MKKEPCLEPGCPTLVPTHRPAKGHTYGWCLKHFLLATMTVELKAAVARDMSEKQSGREWVVHRPTKYSEFYLREKEFGITLFEASPRDALPETERVTVLYSTKEGSS